MQPVSLKIKDEVHSETEKILKRRKMSRNAYINEALEAYNALHRRRELRQQLAQESQMVAATSLEVLAELEALGDLYEN